MNRHQLLETAVSSTDGALRRLVLKKIVTTTKTFEEMMVPNDFQTPSSTDRFP